MTTHQEALEAAIAAANFSPVDPEAKAAMEAAVRAYLTTLAPSDNGLVERLRNGPVTVGKATGEIFELRQAADTITAQAACLSALEALLDKAVDERKIVAYEVWKDGKPDDDPLTYQDLTVADCAAGYEARPLVYASDLESRSALVAPPAQEVVAWMDGTGTELHKLIMNYQKQDMIRAGGKQGERAPNYSIPLYAAPPAVPAGMVLDVERVAKWVYDAGDTDGWSIPWADGRNSRVRAQTRRQVREVLSAVAALTAAQEGR